MGGGRDFTGNMIYRRVGGRYERTQPYKKDYEKLIDSLVINFTELGWTYLSKSDLRGIMRRFGLKDEQLDYIDLIPGIKDRQEMSMGLAKMIMKYGNEMFAGLTIDGKDMEPNTLAHAHYGDSLEIHLNPEYYGSNAKKTPNYDYAAEIGFHPKGNGNEMTIMHEYAHLLERRLAGVSRMQERDLSDVKKRLRDLEKEREEFMKDYDEKMEKSQKLQKQINKLEKLRGTEKYTPKTSAKLMKLYDENDKLTNQITTTDREKFIQLLNNIHKTRNEVNSKQPGLDSWTPIEKIFTKVGASSPEEVAVKLTGNPDAYASKNWSEAHAECVADYMVNGKNASPISRAYVREMNKLFR